jgi:atypical dual specificity phosphatase
MQHNYNNLWWALPGVLAGMGVPYVDPERRHQFGGSLTAYHDELPEMYLAGIRAVVCLLNIPSDARVFQSAGIDFRCLPINDGQPPTTDQAHEFIEFMTECRAQKLPVAVFCEAGAGRTGCMIACYLIHTGMTAAEAIAHVRSIESAAVERVLQIQFLEEFEEQEKGDRE